MRSRTYSWFWLASFAGLYRISMTQLGHSSDMWSFWAGVFPPMPTKFAGTLVWALRRFLYLFVNQRVDFAYLFAAWVFVAFRVLHSAVHCIFNLVMLRFYLYLVSALAVWFIAVRAALSQFGLI